MSDIDEKIPMDLYRLWQEDKVTKTFTRFLEAAEDEAKNQRLNPNVLSETGARNGNYWLGYHEAIRDLLEKFTFNCTEEQ